MTVGSGLSLNITEQDRTRQNHVIRQLIEGRSNAVGTVTLTHDSVATSTAAAAPTCGPNSAVFLFQTTLAAAAVINSTYVSTSDVTPGQFTVRHAATSTGGQTFFWVCLG